MFYAFFPSIDQCKDVQIEDVYENGEVKFMKVFNQYGTVYSRSNFAFTKYHKAPMSRVIAHPDSVYTLSLGQRLHMAPSDFRFSTEQYDSILGQLSEYSNLIALTLNHDRAGDCKLTLEQANEVFGKLSVFKNLEWLDAYHIECKRFPPEILKLTRLKYLKLGRLITSTIPQEISNLKELQYLELSGPEIFLPYNLRNLKQLKELKLSTTQESVYLTSNGLPLIPYATTLRIHCGYAIPAKIYGIPKLTQLELLQIDKGTIVGDLSTLVNLKSFDYRDDVATSLPEGLHNCKNLEKLAIMGKNIRGIDPRIFELPNLKVVKIWYDVISREELAALQEKYPGIVISN